MNAYASPDLVGAACRVGDPAGTGKILRHIYASQLVMKRVDIRTVQKLLGHHSIKMTEKYSHLAPDHLQSVANYLDFEKRGGNFWAQNGHKSNFFYSGISTSR